MKLAEAFVDVKANTDTLGPGLEKSRGMIGSFLSNVNKGVGMGVGMAIAQAGLGSIKDMVSKAVTAGQEAEESMTKVKAALKANGEEVDSNAARYANLAQRMQDSLGIAKKETLELQANLLSKGLGADQIENFTKMSQGLATIMNTDVTGAAENLTEAINGQMEELESKIPKLAELSTHEEKWAYLVKRSEASLKAQAEAMGTGAGKSKSMSYALHDMAEGIGTAIGPAVNWLADKVTYLAKSATAGTAEFMKLEKQMLEWTKTVAEYTLDKRGAMMAQAQLDNLNKRLAMAEKEKKADDTLTIGKIKNRDLEADKEKQSLMSIEDVWKTAQEKMLEKAKGEVKAEADKTKAKEAERQKDKANAAAAKKEDAGDANPRGYVKAAMDRLKRAKDMIENARLDPDNARILGGSDGQGMGMSAPGGLGKRLADYYKNQKEIDSKIAEFGSVAAADKATAAQRAKELYEKRLQDGADNPLAVGDAYARQMAAIDKYYDPRIKKEVEARSKAYDRDPGKGNSLTVDADGAVKVKGLRDAELAAALQAIARVLPEVGGFLPG